MENSCYMYHNARNIEDIAPEGREKFGVFSGCSKFFSVPGGPGKFGWHAEWSFNFSCPYCKIRYFDMIRYFAARPVAAQIPYTEPILLCVRPYTVSG